MVVIIMEESLKYPEVMILKKSVEDHKLVFNRLSTLYVPGTSFITVGMQATTLNFVIPLMDEFSDFDKNKPTLALHLVLMACIEFEEAEDYLVWAKEQGLKAEDERCRTAWFHLRDEVPRIRNLIGENVEPISSFDYQLGAGATQFLRKIDNG